MMYQKNEFPTTGHIPAHILGDNRALQEWTSLIDDHLVIHYPGRAKLDITSTFKANVSLFLQKCQ